MNLYGDDWDAERLSSEGVRVRILHVGHRLSTRPKEGLVGVFVSDVPTMRRDAPFEAFFPRDASRPG
jgi:hypothetical protein